MFGNTLRLVSNRAGWWNLFNEFGFQIPQAYLATNWPIRYSAISADGRLIAIAGRRGLTHYSSTSGRWKSFSDELQEQAFTVRGGLLWFHHVLVVAVEVGRSWQVSKEDIVPLGAILTVLPVAIVFSRLRTQ